MRDESDVTDREMEPVMREFCGTGTWVSTTERRIIAEIVRLRRQVAAMQEEGKADGARLDWLEQAAVDVIEVDRYPDTVFLTWGGGGRAGRGESLRAALDAAREATP